MHKLEMDLMKLAAAAEKKGAMKLAGRLTSLASLAHLYIPDPTLPIKVQKEAAGDK